MIVIPSRPEDSPRQPSLYMHETGLWGRFSCLRLIVTANDSLSPAKKAKLGLTELQFIP